ncbi:MAG: nucleoside triphosphate hydrolase [Alphaproteobacteria bacterium]|nr:nucleoside triphosphate hydrolase [Alphaproteobacteria bacterium]
MQQVAIKEAKEESGLENIELVSSEIFDIDVHLIEAYRNTPPHYHFDVRFLLRTTDADDAIKISQESNDLKWFAEIPTEIQNLGEDIPRMFKKWKAKKCS